MAHTTRPGWLDSIRGAERRERVVGTGHRFSGQVTAGNASPWGRVVTSGTRPDGQSAGFFAADFFLAAAFFFLAAAFFFLAAAFFFAAFFLVGPPLAATASRRIAISS